MQKIEDFKEEFLFILFRQRQIIIITTLLILACSILIAFYWPPTYSATGKILVKGKKAEKTPEALETEDVRSASITKEDMSSEKQILTSPDVIEKTVLYLLEKGTYPKVLPGTKEISLEDEIKSVKGRIKTELIPSSNVIKITFLDKDPDNAVVMLDALMKQYIVHRMEVANPIESEYFYSTQVKKYKEALESRGEDLMKLVEETNMIDPAKEIENNLLLKMDLDKELYALKSKAIEKRQSIKHLSKVLESNEINFFSFLEDIQINTPDGLSPKLQQLIIDRGEKLRTYHPSSDVIRSLDKQIMDQYSLLKSEVITYNEDNANQLLIFEEKIRTIEDTINRISTRNVELKRQLLRSKSIEKDIKLLLHSYETFTKRREEAMIGSSSGSSSFYLNILSKPFPSPGPVFPKKRTLVPLGLIIGFLTGFSFGFLREYFDHTFKKPSDVINFADLPVIFSIAAPR